MPDLTDDQIERMCDKSAERGARKALAELGLHDEGARDDVRELRTLLSTYRDAKTTIIRTFVKAGTLLVLGLLALGSWDKWGR